MAVRYLAHAHEQLSERRLLQEWVERVVASPEWMQPDPRFGRIRAFGAIPEAKGKILRVVYEIQNSDTVVITAFFDRDAKPKKPV